MVQVFKQLYLLFFSSIELIDKVTTYCHTVNKADCIITKKGAASSFYDDVFHRILEVTDGNYINYREYDKKNYRLTDKDTRSQHVVILFDSYPQDLAREVYGLVHDLEQEAKGIIPRNICAIHIRERV